MQNSGDDSILHRLARCFGQGLALGVGLTLTQQALRPKGTQREPALDPPLNPAAAPPRRPAPAPRPEAAAPRTETASRAQLDLRAIQAIVSVVEQRIEERAAQTERTLDEIRRHAAANAEALVSRHVESAMTGVRTQMNHTHREFAHAVARIVSEQVTRGIAKHAAEMEARTQQRIEAAVAPLRAELRELRQRLAATENTMHDFASAISDTVQMANQFPAFRAEGPRETASSHAAARSAAERAPRHLDLRVLRQRLMAADRRDDFRRPALPPQDAPAAHRRPQVVRFPVAS